MIHAISTLDSNYIKQKYTGNSDESKTYNLEISNFGVSETLDSLKKKLQKFHIAKIEFPNYNFMTGSHDGVAKTKIRLNKKQEGEFNKLIKDNN